MNTDFIILCGGQGSRLRPAIGQSQKVLAEVNHRPFLNLLIQHIKAQGGKRVILSTGFQADSVESYYRKNNSGLVIDCVREDVPLGTGGAVKKASAFIHSEYFFVLNGDSFCPVDFENHLNFHQGCHAVCTIAVSPVTDNKDYGTITLDPQKKILAFEEKIASSASRYVNAGVYCFQKSISDFMPKEDRFSIERDFFPKLIGKAFYGFETDKEFIDIGTPERLALAKKRFIQ